MCVISIELIFHLFSTFLCKNIFFFLSHEKKISIYILAQNTNSGHEAIHERIHHKKWNIKESTSERFFRMNSQWCSIPTSAMMLKFSSSWNCALNRLFPSSLKKKLNETSFPNSQILLAFGSKFIFLLVSWYCESSWKWIEFLPKFELHLTFHHPFFSL